MKESAGRQDAYSHVALGNVWLESLFNPLRDRSNVRHVFSLITL